MAAPKNLWTPAMYKRLQSASTFLIAGFVFNILIALLQGAMFGVGWFVLGQVIIVVGLLKMRNVFTDLMNAGPQLQEEEAQRSVSAPARAPVAVRQGTQPQKESGSRWLIPGVSGNRQFEQSRVSSRQKAAEPAWTSTIDWEEFVGKKLLQKLGIVIVLIGMLVFLKYSFDNRWIDELGRVALSALGAGILLGCGEYFHQKYAKWSQAFTGGGLVLLYLTVWVTHIFYAAQLFDKYGIVLPSPFALALYGFITIVGALAAVRYKSQVIAWFTVLGGYVTPFLIDAPSNSQLMIVLYLAILAGGLLVLAWHQKWKYIHAVAFFLTQAYLFGMIYPSPLGQFSHMQQALTAVVFFVLFSLPPLLSQFNLKMKVAQEDVVLLILNALAVFVPVVDALGGINGQYTGIVCLALAVVYLALSAAALVHRSDDALLVNTYLVGTVILVAGALLAEMEREWVAAGWAPFSLLLTFISIRLQRKGPWVCALILLLGSLFFLGINMPVFSTDAEAIWHPFTSNWAIQSYIVFASILGWMQLSKQLPETLSKKENTLQMQNVLHVFVAVLLFLGVTFEASRLDFTIDLVWTFAYIALGVLAIGIFFFTENIVWFIAAFVVQILALLFIFVFGETSGLGFYGDTLVQPFFHPWGYLSVFALLASMAMMYIAQIKKHRFVSKIPAHILMTVVALAQVWVHVSVEIINLSEAYGWSDVVSDRALSAWWIAFALILATVGVVRQQRNVRIAGMALLVLPFLKDEMEMIESTARVYEVALWTVLSFACAIIGSRGKWREIAFAGMLLLAVTAGLDMLSHLGDSGTGFVRSVWWAMVGLLTMVAGFIEREKNMRRLAIILFGATAVKLLLFDFSGLETPVRIGASIAIGLLMIGASYLYQRFDSVLASGSDNVRSAVKRN